MADDISETIKVDTDEAVGNVDKLSKSLENTDEWFDRVVDKARETDREEVSIPVETPGAPKAAEELEHVDKAARQAGDGAKVGVSHISDMTGPLGDASGMASEFGQSFEGLGGIIESAAGKMGLSEAAMGKLTTVLGYAATAVAVAGAAWTIYTGESEKAEKQAGEMRDALEGVYEKLREGDAQAAAQTFVDTMGDKIGKFQQLIGGSISKADIAGVLFGDPAAIAAVDEAVSSLDDKTRLMASGSLGLLKVAWRDAKLAVDENVALEGAVTGFFGGVEAAADSTTGALDRQTDAYDRLGRAVPTAARSAYDAAVAKYGEGNVSVGTTHVTNNYPPANTPFAVEQANTRWRQTQGYT